MHHLDINPDTLDYSKPLAYHAKLFGVSRSTIKRAFIRLGLYDRFYFSSGQNTSLLRHRQLETVYLSNPKQCEHCHTPLPYEQRHYRFCGLKCSTSHYYAEQPERRLEWSETVKRRQQDGTWKKPNPPRITKSRTIKPCAFCGDPMSLTPSETNRRFCSKRCSSSGFDGRNAGGHREGSGRGKKGWYRGYYCQSTWELAWVIYHLDHGVSFSRNTEGFSYLFEGSSHLYYPDFLLGDGRYVEIKGYVTPQWLAKRDQFPHTLEVLDRDAMRPILAYVIETHGKDFIRLYEPQSPRIV